MVKDVIELMEQDREGNYHLVDKVVEGEDFRFFSADLYRQKSVNFKNVVFRKCKLPPHTFFDKEGSWENVTFDNCGKSSRLTIDVRTPMRGLKFVGRNSPKWLEVGILIGAASPQDIDRTRIFSERRFDSDELIDVSEFNGEMRILGVPSTHVKFDPDQQVGLRLNGSDRIPFDQLGISENSFWKIVASFLSNAPETFVDLPTKRDGFFEVAMKEIEILREAGFATPAG